MRMQGGRCTLPATCAWKLRILFVAPRNILACLTYGPSFQGVERLWCGEREALGEVRLPPAVIPVGQTNGKSDGASFHPALLDSCVQVLAAALPEDSRGSG